MPESDYTKTLNRKQLATMIVNLVGTAESLALCKREYLVKIREILHKGYGILEDNEEFKLKECPICWSSKLKIIYEVQFPLPIDKKDNFDFSRKILKCKACGSEIYVTKQMRITKRAIKIEIAEPKEETEETIQRTYPKNLPLKSVNLMDEIATMSQSDLEEYFAWLKNIGYGITWETMTAFILGVRPEFINIAYNFGTPNFKHGYYVKNEENYNIYFLNKRRAFGLLNAEIYGMWRNDVGLKKNTKAWKRELRRLSEV